MFASSTAKAATAFEFVMFVVVSNKFFLIFVYLI